MKRNLLFVALAACLLTGTLISCKKDAVKKETPDPVPHTVAEKIWKMGFDSSSIVTYKDGYLVENDIFFSRKDLESDFSKSPVIRVGKTEQYRTTNLVTGLPRQIRVAVTGLTSNIVQAVDEAIGRYNDTRLDITFVRVSGTADITVSGFYQVSNVLGSSGFPTGGNPYPSITLNTYWFTSSSPVAYVASTIQHEIGHCIGFRHTDYMDRSYSCGGSPVNEGDGGVGAIHIPGSPTGPDAQSFMLACAPSGQASRSFVPNDVFALSYLYNLSHVPRAQPIYEFYSQAGVQRVVTPNANFQLFYSGWNYIGFSFRAFLTQESGTIPIYEYANNVDGDHTYSPNPNDPNILSFPNWYRVGSGPIFYVYSTSAAGRIPVYRYYNASETSTLFTSNNRIHLDYPGWSLQGISWYALPPQ